MRVFSVNETASIFNVSEETVRRWIRDGKLNAKRNLGRTGNEICLDAVVDFANRSSKRHLDKLAAWLEKNGIEFRKVMSFSEDIGVNKDLESTKTTASIIGAALGGAVFGGPVGGLIGGTAAILGSRESVPDYKIVLQQSDSSVPLGDSAQEALQDAEYSMGSIVPECESAGMSVLQEEDYSDISKKIVEERIKLIKLKQELAQLTAQIAICEKQIEYYQLLQEE